MPEVEEFYETDRCNNCGNKARFNVVVTAEKVAGSYVRLACSRLCAEILAERGCEKMCNDSGRQNVTIEVKPMLTPEDNPNMARIGVHIQQKEYVPA